MAREIAAVAWFRDQAARCATDAELADLLDGATRELGFDYFALIHAQSLHRNAPHLIRIDTYPPDWAERLIGRRLYVDDPVLHASLRANCGFAWSDIDTLIPRQQRHRVILEGAARFGLRQGFTVPTNVPFEPAGSCSFATRRTAIIPLWRTAAAELIGGQALKAARRIHGWTRFPPQAIRFSPRETHVMDGLVDGRSNKQIARDLGISPETVKVYVHTLLRKIGAADRARAAVLAAAWGLAPFDASIPPIG